MIHEWMISERHGRIPFCSGSQSLQTRKVSPDRLLAYLIPIPHHLLSKVVRGSADPRA